MSQEQTKSAFVIMPFGLRADVNGEKIDFDVIYRDIIQEPLEAMGFTPLRCDEIEKAGTIHRDMFQHIAGDDLAIVDLTMLNPNVFYELGVRHALKPAITILIQKRGATIPFNIQSERVIHYPGEDGSTRETRETIKKFIAAGLASSQPDSPIFTLLQDARKDWKTERITQLTEAVSRLKTQPNKLISIITGDLRERHGIDVWVNSENTNMQMARFYDRSFSAIVRYEGALKDENGEVLEDTIANELKAQLGERQFVTPGTIYVTSAGALTDSHGVKKIFHAATVSGVPGGGYQVMQEVERCVTNALRRMDQNQLQAADLRSIAFPMLGTGAGGGKVDEVVPLLIRAAITYLTQSPLSRIETVYFSAWNHRDLEACTLALKNASEVEPQ